MGIENKYHILLRICNSLERCAEWNSLFRKIYVTSHSIVISVILNKFSYGDQNLNEKLLQALLQMFDTDIWPNRLLIIALKILLKLGSR